MLFRAGDPGEELFLIRDGSIVVSKPVTGRVEQVLSRLGAGEVFGEMSVFGDERRRSATCQAELDTCSTASTVTASAASSPAARRRGRSSSSRWRRSAFKRLRDSSDLVAEVTRWGLEATGLDIEHK